MNDKNKTLETILTVIAWAVTLIICIAIAVTLPVWIVPALIIHIRKKKKIRESEKA